MVMPPNDRASVAIIGVMKEFFELRAGALKFTSLNGSTYAKICQYHRRDIRLISELSVPHSPNEGKDVHRACI